MEMIEIFVIGYGFPFSNLKRKGGKFLLQKGKMSGLSVARSSRRNSVIAL